MLKKLLLLPIIASTIALATTPTYAQETEQVTIKHWDGFVTQSPALQRAISEFEAAHPNIKIDRQIQTNAGELLPLAFEGGIAPDVFTGVPLAETRTYHQAGRFKAFNSYPDWEEFLATFPQPETRVQRGTNLFGDDVVSMPFDAPFWYLQMYVNVDLYERAGLVDAQGNPQLPVSFDQVLENSRIINQQTGAFGYGFSPDNWSFAAPFQMCIRTNGGYFGWAGLGWSNVEGKFDFATNPCYRQVIDLLVTMRDEGLIPPQSLSINDEQLRVLFAEGQVAHIFGGFWVIPGFEQTHPDFTNYTSVPLPLVGTETPAGAFGTTGAGGAFYINANTAHPDEAWEWVKFLYSEEFGQIWAEEKAGLSIFTPGDPAQYTTQQNRGYFETSQTFLPQPDNRLRNPEVGEVQVTVIGPQPIDVLTGIYTGQITDIDAALADLDTRSQQALDLAISDAQTAGFNVTIEDFICRDWNPAEPYPAEGECNSGYPGAEGAVPTQEATASN
jgi:ABC-type glycerol-3-phosphate transport system substrate-binding protein